MQREAEPRASPTTAPPVVPAEIENLILRLYPDARTRHSIRHSIYDHVKRLHDQGRSEDITDFLDSELQAMKAEDKAQQKGKRHKLTLVGGKTLLVVLAIYAKWFG